MHVCVYVCVPYKIRMYYVYRGHVCFGTALQV